MNNYIAFLYSGLRKPGVDNVSDGEHLALDCCTQLKSLDDPNQFPPQLLILLTSPNYLEGDAAKELITGIKRVFDKELAHLPPLIGTSVAAVFFDRQIHENGALLICLASRLIKADVAVGKNAVDHPVAAVSQLLARLNLDNPDADLNPMSNRMLLTFFPDIRKDPDGAIIYSSDKLHELLWRRTLCRIPIAGGTSSSSRGQSDLKGLQFGNWEVFRDSLVAAQVDSGVPMGVSLCRGLERLLEGKEIIRERVLEISEDGCFITKLDGVSFDELNHSDVLLLGEDTVERDLIMAISEPSDPRQIRIIDRVRKGDTLQVLKPRPESIVKLATQMVRQSSRRVRVTHPLGCLSLICSAHYRSPQHATPYIEGAVEKIERAFQAPCVGGFVDGEAGVDETGRSQFGNWSMVGIVFGDEMRDRTPRYRGFKALADYSDKLTVKTTLEQAVDFSLELVFETGYPGAMISFPLLDQNQNSIVGMKGCGSRFEKLVAMRRPLDGENAVDAVANVIRGRTARFVRDTREEPDSHLAEKEAGLVSQYIIPLRGPEDRDIIAVLQVDLGDVTYKPNLDRAEEEVLDLLGAAIGAEFNRIVNWEIVKVARQMDEALKESLKFKTLTDGMQHFIEKTSEAFGTKMGHVRLANYGERVLKLVAGVGPYFKAAKVSRLEVNFDDSSPTCEAFGGDGSTVVVNDAANNPANRQMIEGATDGQLRRALERVGSYANTRIQRQDGSRVGTINIVSRRPWFFTWQHWHSLEALGQRAGFLVEHFEQKEGEAKANKRLDFLHKASPPLTPAESEGTRPAMLQEWAARFDDMPIMLQTATENFLIAAHAHVASLYLWDETLGRYVLRAQDGWVDPTWINKASYEKDDGWIGSQMFAPIYHLRLGADNEHFFGQMFGSEFEKDEIVSAIGLPLIVGSESLGVLALYRRNMQGDLDGFPTTDSDDLREAAKSMTALVSILFSHQGSLFREKLQRYLKRISEIFLREDAHEVLVRSLCQLIIELFGATSADFYYRTEAESPIADWIAGYSSLAASNARARREPDEMVREVIAKRDLPSIRQETRDGVCANPAAIAAVGRIVRLCIPILSGQKTEGALDVCWDDEGLSELQWEIVRPNSVQLRILGTAIGSAYSRYKLAVSQKRKQRRYRVMYSLLTQSEHHVKNLLATLGFVPELITEPTEDRNNLAILMSERLMNGRKSVDRLLKLARQGANLDPKFCNLKSMIQEVVSEEKETTNSRGIREEIEVDDSLKVYIDDNSVRESFKNIISNSIEAMKGNGTLRIIASKDTTNTHVTIVFKDFGGGMSEEMIRDATNGHLEKDGCGCSGIYITSNLIQTQGGTFRIESDAKEWTEVYITLPLTQMEENI